MAQGKSSAVAPFLRELVSLEFYKRSQGRIARQATMGALAAVLLIGAWRLSEYWAQGGWVYRDIVPAYILSQSDDWKAFEQADKRIEDQVTVVDGVEKVEKVPVVDERIRRVDDPQLFDERFARFDSDGDKIVEAEEVRDAAISLNRSENWLLVDQFVLPGLVLGIGGWIAFRVVNIPRFADFLIAVEAEMNKVSWPTRSELIRALIVVLITIFFLGAVLFGYDLLWRFLLTQLGIVG